MKDSRFTELLNLYIDRQITAAETAELEAELQGDPKRQAVYRQYCQVHSATKLAYQSFRAGAAESSTPASGRKGVVELFETRRDRTKWGYYAAGFAAACLALVFVRQSPVAPATAPVLAAQPQAKTPVVVVAAAPAPTVVTPTLVTAPQPGLVSLRNTAVTPDYSAMLAALREQDEQRTFARERMQADRVLSLFQDDMFESGRALTAQEQRVYRSQPATNTPQAEFSAFQFQR